MTPPSETDRRIPVKIVSGGTTYPFMALPVVRRYRINDRPQAFRTSQAEAFQGQYRDPLSLGGITDAFGARAIGPWDPRGSIADHLAHGHVHVGHDFEAETRFGYIALPRQRNAATFPAFIMTGTELRSVFCGSTSGAGAPSYNDKPTVAFAGSAVTGTFGWVCETNTAADDQASGLYWNGSAWAAAGTIFVAVANNDRIGVYDLEVHKNRLYCIGDNNDQTTTLIYYSTTGNTWTAAAATGITAGALPGSRLQDDGNNLWAFVQVSATAFTIQKSTDNAVNFAAAAAGLTNIRGRLRSTDIYYDRTGTARVVFLTEDALYALDDTNNVPTRLWSLPAAGRGMIVWGESLYIFMDAMRVVKYTQGESSTAIEDVSPGGGEAMPSGKDFGQTTNGVVCLYASSLGVYALWSGTNQAGTLLRDLCLMWDRKGRHFIFRNANTTNNVAYGARWLAIDPSSGDLLGCSVSVDGGQEVRNPDGYRIIDAETDPRLLSANIFETAGFAETPLITPPPSEVTTTGLDLFYNSENLATTGVTIQSQYGTNGDAATTNTVESSAVQVNRAKRYFPSDAAAATVATGVEGVGVNFSTIRYRHTFAGLATSGVVLYNSVLGFTKPTDAKYLRAFEIDTKAKGPGIPTTAKQIANIDTIQDIKTKVTITYGNKSVTALPVSQDEAKELVGDLADPTGDPRSGIWTLYFAQV